MKGAALSDFLLRKAGRQVRWDAEPAPSFSIDDLDSESFNIFRAAAKLSGRITESDLQVSNEELLRRLNLVNEDGILKRAAVLLFHRYPEKLISSCYVKIGKFGKGSDLQYQEEVRGSLFLIADRLIDVIYLKYLTASISYKKDIRVERYPYPREALREIIYNALIHCDWSADEPIQIKITDKTLSVSNVGKLPLGWTHETLFAAHKSKPFNPNIANTFFRAGYVETWGRGIEKVNELCKSHSCLPPVFEVLGHDITVIFSHQPTQPSRNLESLSDLEELILFEISNNSRVTLTAIATKAAVSKRTVQNAINRLCDAQIILREGSTRAGSWKILSKNHLPKRVGTIR